jgi:hypothetical protein
MIIYATLGNNTFFCGKLDNNTCHDIALWLSMEPVELGWLCGLICEDMTEDQLTEYARIQI